MKLTVTAMMSIVLLTFALWAASGTAFVGKWNCASVSNGTDTKVFFTLNVKNDAEKLSVSLTMAQTGDEIPALEPSLEGNTLRFKVRINSQETVDLSASVDGNQITGTFKGKESGTGTFMGSRAA